MVFLDNTARRPTQSEVASGRINPSPTKTLQIKLKAWNADFRGFGGFSRIFSRLIRCP
ncbi:MAG: hypothetical protein FWG87_05730 [Defluviitaleaceae bacterium]|nr:hypothetical protein [Defluviitaleaceae bacterium]